MTRNRLPMRNGERDTSRLDKHETIVLGVLYNRPEFTGTVVDVTKGSKLSETQATKTLERLASWDRALELSLKVPLLDGNQLDGSYTVTQSWLDRLQNPPRRKPAQSHQKSTPNARF